MIHSEEKVKEMILVIAREIGIVKQIENVTYRKDYQDYQVTVDKNSHFEIREKLVENFFSEKSADTRREIEFRLKNPVKFEDWEDAPDPTSDSDQIVIDPE